MSFSDYKTQAKAKWGDTEAYKEFEQNSKGRTNAQEDSIAAGIMDILRKLGERKDEPADSVAVQELISELQKYISDNYYKCTDEILAGLGEMYTADEDMTENIDAVGGKGTAEFTARAIRAFCK